MNKPDEPSEHGDAETANETDVDALLDAHPYAASLKGLIRTHKRLGSVLADAELSRTFALSRLADDVRLSGVDNLLARLDDIAKAFAAEPRLRKIAFLVIRVIKDFETALESTLSSYAAVAFDAMRDVLEVEYLLLDFALNEELIEEWLGADERRLMSQFAPQKVRQRLKRAGVGNLGEGGKSADYKGHSMMLHVGPSTPPFLPAKGRTLPDPFGGDMGFWEIYEHARGFWSALAILSSRLAPDSEANRLVLREPTEVSDAWKETGRRRHLFQSIIEAGIKRSQGEYVEAGGILGVALRDIGVLSADDLEGPGAPEKLLEAAKGLSSDGDPAVRMAAMGLVKILEGSSASESE